MVAYYLSIVQGYDYGTFKPGQFATRAEFTKMFTENNLPDHDEILQFKSKFTSVFE